MSIVRQLLAHKDRKSLRGPLNRPKAQCTHVNHGAELLAQILNDINKTAQRLIYETDRCRSDRFINR